MSGVFAGVDPVTLGLFVAVGFLASGHCVGMCGPLVSLYAGRMPTSRRRQLTGHTLFNLGRTLSYAAMGALFGALGALTTTAAGQLPGQFGAVRGLVGVFAGLLVVAAGLAQLAGTPNPLLSGTARGLWVPLGRVSRVVRRRLDDWLDGPGAAALGVIHGFFPCPLLYPAYVYAFAVADPVTGSLALAALGVGTIPAVFVFGVLFDPSRLGHTTTRAVGGAFVLLGAGTGYAGLRSLGLPLPGPTTIPIATPEGATLPILLAVPIAVLGSLLLLGVAVSALVRRRSRSYLFVVLALTAFAGQVFAGQLVTVGALTQQTAQQVSVVASAAIVVLLVAAVHAVANNRTAPEMEPRGGEP